MVRSAAQTVTAYVAAVRRAVARRLFGVGRVAMARPGGRERGLHVGGNRLECWANRHSVPKSDPPIFIAWLVIAFPIGWTVSRVLLLTMSASWSFPWVYGSGFAVGTCCAFAGSISNKLLGAEAGTTDVATYFRQS